MPILDSLLGNSGNSNESSSANAQSNSNSADLATNPQVSANASDILQSFNSSSDDGNGGGSDTSAFSGVGGLGLDAASPTAVAFDNASQSFDSSNNQSDSDGGLLSGVA